MLTALSPLFTADTPVQRDAALWSAAQSLEASFLTEMLKSAGLGTPRDAFGGGAGEVPFAGFLAREYATGLTEAGGLGLAESIYRSLVKETPTT